jgi:hypothetical protein
MRSSFATPAHRCTHLLWLVREGCARGFATWNFFFSLLTELTWELRGERNDELYPKPSFYKHPNVQRAAANVGTC